MYVYVCVYVHVKHISFTLYAKFGIPHFFMRRHTIDETFLLSAHANFRSEIYMYMYVLRIRNRNMSAYIYTYAYTYIFHLHYMQSFIVFYISMRRQTVAETFLLLAVAL